MSSRYILLRFHLTTVSLTIVLFYELRSRMLCTQWMYPCHVFRLAYLYVFLPVSHVSDRVLVCSRSRFTCLFTLPFWTHDSSVLTVLSYAYLFRLVDSSVESLFLEL